MTTLRVTWEYDAEDDVTRTAESERFFAAWVDQFGTLHYTCTDEDEFGPLLDVMEEAES